MNVHTRPGLLMYIKSIIQGSSRTGSLTFGIICAHSKHTNFDSFLFSTWTGLLFKVDVHFIFLSRVLRFQPLRILTGWTADGSLIVGLALARNGHHSCINSKTEAGEVRDPSLYSQMLGSTHIRGKIILPSFQHWIRKEGVKADRQHRRPEFIH